MALTWRGRRQITYYAVGGVIAVGLLVLGYNAFLSGAPTCRDGIQNQDEQGVDCGGTCTLVCRAQAREPVVLWSRAFNTGPGRYTAAAYIQNSNNTAGARSVGYAFQLFDADNNLVVERRGSMDLPPNQTIPIVEANIDTGTREVTRTLFAFSEVPVWHSLRQAPPQLRITDQTLDQGGARLTATLVNESRIDATRAAVVAVLFDAAGVARAASKSVMTVAARDDEFVVFTWNPAPQGVVRGEITVLPPF